jgi:hypothetical protein
MSMDGEYTPIQFFHQTSPTRADVLESLRLALALLQFSLPIAMRNLGSATIEAQYWFWWAFEKFDDANDVMQDAWGTADPLREMDRKLEELNDNVGELLMLESSEVRDLLAREAKP